MASFVERWFRDLTDKRLRRDSLDGASDPIAASEDQFMKTNQNPDLVWRNHLRANAVAREHITRRTWRVDGRGRPDTEGGSRRTDQRWSEQRNPVINWQLKSAYIVKFLVEVINSSHRFCSVLPSQVIS